MNLNKLIKVLTEQYKAKYKNVSLPAPYVVPLLAEPTQKQLKQLNNGDGNPIAEMCQINSSAGLAFNYYKLFEHEKQKEYFDFEVKFENKVAKPLRLKNNGGKYANLDVSYYMDGTQFYIESKFLEPYYSKCKHNTCSYYNKDKQGGEVDNYRFSKEETALWLELLGHEKYFQYYDFPQLYRHLLAIRRRHNKQGKVELQSVSWEMPDTFKEKYGLTEDDEKMLKTLDDERQKSKELFKGFLSEIGWTDCCFEMKCYNDMLGNIEHAPKYCEFRKQYFLDRLWNGK